MVYLDNAATTAVSAAAHNAMFPFLHGEYGNPSSAHQDGRRVREAIDRARRQVASCIGARPEEIYFTSGGSESDNWALKGAALSDMTKKHIITSVIEHPAILRTCDFLESLGWSVTRIPVDEGGIVNPTAVERAIRPDTRIISIMTANNEIGTIQPIAEIGAIAEKHHVLFHTDAVQAVGAIPINVDTMGVHLLSMSGHKFHAPKGTGALFIRDGVHIAPLIHGGGQERGQRSGTENVAGIVALGAALAEVTALMEKTAEHCNTLKTKLLIGLHEAGVEYKINGYISNRLPNNINLSFPKSKVDNIPMRLDYAGFSVSSGSACSSGSGKASHVLTAIGCTKDEMRTSVRITFSDAVTVEDVQRLVDALATILKGA